MPVRELTERPLIPRLGKVRLGERDEQTKRLYNRPYFVIPEEVAAVYGPEPTELPIVFLTDDEELIASQYYRAYNTSSGLICRGDGYKADALLDEAALAASGGELTIDAWAHGKTRGRAATERFVRREITCAGAGYGGAPPCPMFEGKRCAVRMFMQFAIARVPGLGVYQMDTGSVHGIKNVNGLIQLVKSLTGGRVAGVPLLLRREKVDVAPDGLKKSVWTVTLRADTEMSIAALLEHARRAPAAALLPPVDETEVYEPVEDDEEAGDDDGDARREVSEPDLRPQDGTTGVLSQDAPPAAPPPNEHEGPPPAPEEIAATDPATPAARRAAPDPVALLRRLEDTRGIEAKRAAIAAMTRLFGTATLTRLDEDQRADWIEVLRTRLIESGHEHEEAYTPDGRLVCRRCGDELPPGPRVAGQEAQETLFNTPPVSEAALGA